MLHDFQHYKKIEFICTEGYSFSKKDKRGNILLVNFQDKTKKIIALESFSKPIHDIKRVDGNLYAFSTYTGRSIPFAMGLGDGDYLIYLISLEHIL